ncbi:alcohol dehydrogenase [Diaporthe eres]|nr:alcohol dehydrogenase [Diaporthe eres]
MGLYSILPDTINEVDVIVAGARRRVFREHVIVQPSAAVRIGRLKHARLVRRRDSEIHEQVGPGNYRGRALEGDFISAVGKLGWPELPDNNILDSINRSMHAQRYVGPDGKRQDTAHAYIHPKLESGEFPNLHVLVETDVERVIIDDNKTSVGPDQTMDGLLAGRVNVAELTPKNDPLLSWNGVDVQCKLRPSGTGIASLGTQFQAAWEKDLKSYPDKPLMILSIVSCFPGDPSGVPAGQCMGVGF